MEIRLATLEDRDKIVELIKRRMKWMDEKDLYQWNKTGYLERYPNIYFDEKINEKIMFVAVEAETVVGVMALFKEDERWKKVNDKALYVHHLAVDETFKGLGVEMLKFAEEYGREIKVDFIRLDSQKTNLKLNNYYENIGYRNVGECIDGVYEGYRREKKILN
ncbi:MAG: GNAT family N-acetyltransferase [Clostridium sp.]|uniref:GNAT family N-acetyltransferase n=1 Tax=Clostridium sp. TaxID=1506 RepID=UPI003F2E1DA0